MGEGRKGGAEGLEEADVLGRVRQMVLAADHVADHHRGVVDHDREVVERSAVGADDDQVATESRCIDLDPAANEIVKDDAPLADPEANGRASSLGLEIATLVGRQPGTSTDIVRRLVGSLLGLPVGIELVGGAVAAIGLVA